jgi:hypothetical protein
MRISKEEEAKFDERVDQLMRFTFTKEEFIFKYSNATHTLDIARAKAESFEAAAEIYAGYNGDAFDFEAKFAIYDASPVADNIHKARAESHAAKAEQSAIEEMATKKGWCEE